MTKTGNGAHLDTLLCLSAIVYTKLISARIYPFIYMKSMLLGQPSQQAMGFWKGWSVTLMFGVATM